MPQPWDIPPTLASGDAGENGMYLAVGRALTAWEYVEEAFADIFATFVGAHESREPEVVPAFRAYGSVITSRGRADMLYRVPGIVTRGRFPDGGESDSTWRTQEARHVGSDTIAPGF